MIINYLYCLHISPDLQEICEYNDITEEQLICAPETITKIEMFMQGIPQICCMSFFPNLVSLSLIHQNIPSIEGLHNCPCLHVLRLNENVIDRWYSIQCVTFVLFHCYLYLFPKISMGIKPEVIPIFTLSWRHSMLKMIVIVTWSFLWERSHFNYEFYMYVVMIYWLCMH